jgi:hypothetical protein
MTHYLQERNHQGLENQRIRPELVMAANNGTIQRRTRLGGMLSYYRQVAA